jgi:hypothetical protein
MRRRISNSSGLNTVLAPSYFYSLPALFPFLIACDTKGIFSPNCAELSGEKESTPPAIYYHLTPVLLKAAKQVYLFTAFLLLISITADAFLGVSVNDFGLRRNKLTFFKN